MRPLHQAYKSSESVQATVVPDTYPARCGYKREAFLPPKETLLAEHAYGILTGVQHRTYQIFRGWRPKKRRCAEKSALRSTVREELTAQKKEDSMETVFILMLITFILGLVSGVALARPVIK